MGDRITTRRGSQPGFAVDRVPDRTYTIELNYRKGNEEVFLGRLNIKTPRTKSAIESHQNVCDWFLHCLLGGIDPEKTVPGISEIDYKGTRPAYTATEVAVLIRCGQKPGRVLPNQAFIFDGKKCLWRIDLDNPNKGVEAEVEDSTGKLRKLYLLREFDRDPQPQPAEFNSTKRKRK